MSETLVDVPVDQLLLADVALDVPDQDAFTYLVSDEMAPLLQVGDAVTVPLGRRQERGFVLAIERRAKPAYTVRAILSRRDDLHLPAALIRLIRWGAAYYRCGMGSFLAAAVPAPVRSGVSMVETRRLSKADGYAGKLTKRQREVLAQLGDASLTRAELCQRAGCAPDTLKRLIAAGALIEERTSAVQELHLEARREDHQLNDEQQVAYDAVYAALEAGGFAPFLLYGVTGSGKTLVYMDLADQVIAAGRQVLILLPEIALTPQLAARFRQRFERVVVWHSGFTGGERHEQWQRVRRGEVDMVIGTRSALFAPLEQIGLIVVDEEHDSSYKQDSTPRYHGRDLAVVYARQLGVPVVLGSATPSVETVANAKAKRYEVLMLRKRPAGGLLPTPMIVDMREECQAQGKATSLSRELVTRLQGAKERGEQSIILLNRRGWSPVVHCRSCGATMTCDNCDISLTYHRGPDLLRCHYCDHERAMPGRCPACQEPGLALGGVGTEQLASQLIEAVPGLRVLRLDADTVGERQGHAKMLHAFGGDDFDCLLGTQMVAKGLNFPRVTVVGVIAADHGLQQPDFRAAERSFQLIAQVAGRAGRGERPGVVVVQAFDPQAIPIRCALENRPKRFYDEELAQRSAYGYPPSSGLVRFLWRGASAATVETLAMEHGALLRRCAEDMPLLGPGPAAIPFLKGKHRWHALLKAGSRGAAQAMLDRLRAAGWLKEKGGVQVQIDVDPYSFS